MKTIHKLTTAAGVEIAMTFDELTGHFSCEWSPPPPFTPDLRRAVVKEYLPWRNAIFESWSKRTGKRVVVVTL